MIRHRLMWPYILWPVPLVAHPGHPEDEQLYTTLFFGLLVLAIPLIVWLIADGVKNSRSRSRQNRSSEPGALYRVLFQSSAYGMINLSETGRVHSANQTAGTILGIEPEKLAGRHLDEILGAGFLDQLTTVNGFAQKELFLDRLEKPVWCKVTISGSQQAGSILILDDITVARELALAAQRHGEALARSNKALEEFAFVASHDLNEPLNKIAAFGKLLRQYNEDKLDQESLEYIDYMQSATLRMRNLIDSLLELSRITAQGNPFEHVELDELVAQIIIDYKLRIEESDAEIEVEPLPAVWADPVQMRQLFQNLIGNALKFHLADHPPVIRIRGNPLEPNEEGKRFCRVIVRDRGIGFDPMHAEKIFNPLQRLNPKTAYSGTGIGLAICKKIVGRHQGHIAARSNPGKGATFAVMLPLSTARSDNPQNEKAPSST